MRSALAVAAILLLCPAAFAQEMAPALIEAARADIAQGNYEAGIVKLDKAYGLDPKPEIIFEVAVAYSQWQGHCQDAITYFDRFFQVCGQCESFAAAKERHDRVRAACTVKVKVETEPSGAMISIDGDPIGSSPLSATVIAGKHAFEAELTGYDAPSASHSVAPGQETVIKLSLTPLPAYVEFQNVSPEATVLISGVPARPPKMEVQPGRHKIEASRPGYESKTVEVVARRGETAQVDLTLAPERTTYRLYMWASVGIGVFALATTAAFALMANEAKNDKKMAMMLSGRNDPEFLESFDNRIKSRTTLAIVTGSVAGAAGIAALVFYLIEPDEEVPADKVALGFGPEGLVVRGSF
jgi:hypothetical protein